MALHIRIYDHGTSYSIKIQTPETVLQCDKRWQVQHPDVLVERRRTQAHPNLPLIKGCGGLPFLFDLVCAACDCNRTADNK